VVEWKVIDTSDYSAPPARLITRCDSGPVCGQVVSQPGDAHQPAGGSLGQIDTASALIKAGCLAGDRLTRHLLVGAAVGGPLNFVLNPVAVDVVAGIYGLKCRPREADAHGEQLSVADRPYPRRATAQLGADSGLILDRRDTPDIGLVHGPGSPLPLHAREVPVALGILQRGVVEVDISRCRRALELALPDGHQHLGNSDRAQTVAGFGWRFWPLFVTLGAINIKLACCSHAFLQAIKTASWAVWWNFL